MEITNQHKSAITVHYYYKENNKLKDRTETFDPGASRDLLDEPEKDTKVTVTRPPSGLNTGKKSISINLQLPSATSKYEFKFDYKRTGSGTGSNVTVQDDV